MYVGYYMPFSLISHPFRRRVYHLSEAAHLSPAVQNLSFFSGEKDLVQLAVFPLSTAAVWITLFCLSCSSICREGEILRKLPGDIDGQPFDLTALRRCEVALLDHSEAVQVDELIDCRYASC